MDRFITNYEGVSLWQATRSTVSDIVQFVIDENYKHHQGGVTHDDVYLKETFSVLMEELEMFDYSSTIIARDFMGEIVGVIRTTHWNNNPHKLPMQILFGEDIVTPSDLIACYQHLWHIGRFAVKQEYSNKGVLFKLLMLYAISPIFKYREGVLLAETDAKLLRVMQALSIEARPLSTGREYIGSLTIPMMATKAGLTPFLLNNISMAFDLHFEELSHRLPERVKKPESKQNYPFGYCVNSKTTRTLPL